jgi:hypothetical protein
MIKEESAAARMNLKSCSKLGFFPRDGGKKGSIKHSPKTRDMRQDVHVLLNYRLLREEEVKKSRL